jgi:hypothetical protein
MNAEPSFIQAVRKDLRESVSGAARVGGISHPRR